MRLATSAQVSAERAAACSASALATSRLRSRLPQKGSGCIKVYLVSPTPEGDRVALWLPFLVMFSSSMRSTGSGRAPAGWMRSRAASASRRAMRRSALLARAAASNDSTLVPGKVSPAMAGCTVRRRASIRQRVMTMPISMMMAFAIGVNMLARQQW